MDGPFAIDISTDSHRFLIVTFVHKDSVRESAETSMRELLENATVVGKQVLASCQRRGWAGKDVDSLAEATHRGDEVLRNLKDPA